LAHSGLIAVAAASFARGDSAVQVHALRIIRHFVAAHPEGSALPFALQGLLSRFCEIGDRRVAVEASAVINGVVQFRPFEPDLILLLGALGALLAHCRSALLCENAARTLRMLLQCDVRFLAAIAEAGLIRRLSRGLRRPPWPAWAAAYLAFLEDAVAIAPERAAYAAAMTVGRRALGRLMLEGDELALPALAIAVGLLQIERTDPRLREGRFFVGLFRGGDAPAKRVSRDFSSGSWQRKWAIVALLQELVEWGNAEATRTVVAHGFFQVMATVLDGSPSRWGLAIAIRALLRVTETAHRVEADRAVVRALMTEERIFERMSALRDDEELWPLAAVFFSATSST
jgi:hypothetical protein